MDIDRITHPLRLAKGPHQPGSGKGCAMNAISYIHGDTRITDFPECSARPLAAFVQVCNDLLAGPDGYLSPENSLLALELGWQTVGTADVDEAAIHAWVAELLTSPTWGVLGYAELAARYAKNAADNALVAIAELHRAAAAGHTPSSEVWTAADRAARNACRASKPTLHVAGLYALRAAYHSATPLNAEDHITLDAVAGFALQAHMLAAADRPRWSRRNASAAATMVELTRDAIQTWRRLGGLDSSKDIDAASVDNATQRISTVRSHSNANSL
jgi:hypothetical protein